MAYKILVVDDEPITRKMVSSLLEQKQYVVGNAGNGKECLETLKEFKPDLILLDVMMPEMDGLETCRAIRSNPETAMLPVIMLTALDTVEQRINGFEAGADDYLPKPFNMDELLAHINVFLRENQLPEKHDLGAIGSTTIAVFSLRGGSGVTSIAVNLAAGLAELWDMDVAMVDMVPVAGQTALFLNQTLKSSWGDLAKKNIEDIDDEAVKSVLLKHPNQIQTLASPSKPEEGSLITSAKTLKVIEILQRTFPYVVFDLPHDLSDNTLCCLDKADVIVLVLQPEITSVRAAKIALDMFLALNYVNKQVYYVLNWTFPRNGLSIDDIDRFTKHKMDLIIPYATDEFIAGINNGKPLVLTAPDKSIGQLFKKMAMTLSNDKQLQSSSQKPRSTWLRIQEQQQKKK
jgi:pilus assembly protein CpaE